MVWLPMLPGDDVITTQGATRLVPDRRARHFYDPQHHAGRAVAASVGWSNSVAWDIYLFYAPGHSWRATLPAPSAWMHQLGDHQADGSPFHCGVDLWQQLQRTMQQLLAAPQ